MRSRAFVVVLVLAVFGSNSQAGESTATDAKGDQSETSRVGTCEDAKSQMEYFCETKNAAKDSMVSIGTACNNAKNNVKEACEGIVQPDKEYKFNKN